MLILLNNCRYMQYLAAVTATLSVASCATYVVWASPSLPKLTSKHSPIGTTVTTEEASWVVSSCILGVIPGAFLTAWMVEKYGRKFSLLFAAGPLFLPWIAIAFAKSAKALVVARFTAGLGMAAAMITLPLYIGEIAEKDIRGKLGITFNILNISGGVFVRSVGPFVSYKVLALCCSVFPLLFAGLFYFMPESPYFLVKVGKYRQARRNVVRLSSNSTDDVTIDARMKEIEKTVMRDFQHRSSVWDLFLQKQHRKPLMIIIGLKVFLQFSGIIAIDSYMQVIIASSNSSISPEVSSILCGLVQIPAVFITAALIDRMGRKPFYTLSALGCAVALTSEGIYFFLQNVRQADVRWISWLPTTGLMLYLVMHSMGIFTLPFILMGELFATNIKGKAASAGFLSGAVLAFLVLKFFGPLSAAWGIHTMFWIFASCCVLGSAFVSFVVPETKGKTLAEIQERLNSGYQKVRYQTIAEVVA